MDDAHVRILLHLAPHQVSTAPMYLLRTFLPPARSAWQAENGSVCRGARGEGSLVSRIPYQAPSYNEIDIVTLPTDEAHDTRNIPDPATTCYLHAE